MRENGVAQNGEGKFGEHRRLHNRHDFTGLGADHREAENAIVAGVDQRFHKSVQFIDRTRSQDGGNGQSGDANGDAALCRFLFGEADMCDLRIGEQAGRNNSVSRGPFSTSEIVADDSEIVEGNVRKLRAPGAFADRPDIWSGCFQAIIHLQVTELIQLDAGQIQSDSGGIGNTSGRDKDIAGLDCFILSGRPDNNSNPSHGSAAHAGDFRRSKNVNSFSGQYTQDFGRNVRVLLGEQLRTVLNDRHAAAKTAISLCKFQADITTADHDEMFGEPIEFQSLDVRQRHALRQAGYRRD